MHGPALSGWLLMALCGATGGYGLVRMRGGAGENHSESHSEACGAARSEARGEALMGFGMAVMAAPAAVLALPGWSWLVYSAVFGGTALGALWSARYDARALHHAVGSLAMVYMAVAMGPGAGQGGHHTAAGLPVLTGALLAYYTGYVLLAGARLAPAPGVGTGAADDPVPGLAPACRLAMGLGMLTMLLLL